MPTEDCQTKKRNLYRKVGVLQKNDMLCTMVESEFDTHGGKSVLLSCLSDMFRG